MCTRSRLFFFHFFSLAHDCIIILTNAVKKGGLLRGFEVISQMYSSIVQKKKRKNKMRTQNEELCLVEHVPFCTFAQSTLCHTVL